MNTDSEPEVGVSLWEGLKEFHESGLTKEQKEHLTDESFLEFASQLRLFYSEPFKAAAELVEGETAIYVATPKSPKLEFKKACGKCREAIPGEEIHFEVNGEEDLIFLCKTCFFSQPYQE